ncbi:hypothetical protein GCM10010510_18930 [Streptomyces anandii JCM 4720]|nr:hypothetical protein GCM10010510_18930 [Streptomyces anandii JCM 4720]
MRSCGKATGADSAVGSVMEDLADEGCVVPIFIRCPRHLWCDEKFGQIGHLRELAGKRLFRCVIRLPWTTRGPQDPAMPTIVVPVPPLSAAARPAARRQRAGRPERSGPPPRS